METQVIIAAEIVDIDKGKEIVTISKAETVTTDKDERAIIAKGEIETIARTVIAAIVKTLEVVTTDRTVIVVIARIEIGTIVITEMIAIVTDAKNVQDTGMVATAAVHGTHHVIGLEEETPPETKKTGIIAVADQ